MKQCTKCKESKPDGEFYQSKRNKDGLQSYCKACAKVCALKWNKGNKERHLAYKKKYSKTITGHLHNCFISINHRCNNKEHQNYKYYGNRGIGCSFKSPTEFIDYVLNGLQVDPRGLTIDRIDNDGDYERGNIRFVTQAENNRNKPKKRRRA